MPLPTPEGPMGWVDVGIPTVLEDDRVALPIYVRNTAATPSRYQLLLHTPGGGTALHTLGEGQETNGTWVNPYKAVPNGLGGSWCFPTCTRRPPRRSVLGCGHESGTGFPSAGRVESR